MGRLGTKQTRAWDSCSWALQIFSWTNLFTQKSFQTAFCRDEKDTDGIKGTWILQLWLEQHPFYFLKHSPNAAAKGEFHQFFPNILWEKNRPPAGIQWNGNSTALGLFPPSSGSNFELVLTPLSSFFSTCKPCVFSEHLHPSFAFLGSKLAETLWVFVCVLSL